MVKVAKEVCLGDKVKDTVTGFTGIVVSITEYLQGCKRISVAAKVKQNALPGDWANFDMPQVKVIESAAVKEGSKKTGGPRAMTANKTTPRRR